MKTLTRLGAIVVLGSLLCLPGAPARQPNVIVVFTDDQGSVDAGCYGSGDIDTPSIDALAAQGIRFTRFYSASAVCSPSRAGLLTGRYPWIAGMENNGPATVPESINDLTESHAPGGLPSSEVTMAEMFRAAGYRTGLFGKWHLGHGDGSRPLDQGFDVAFGHINGCIDNYSHFVYWNGENRHDLWDGNTRLRMPGSFFPNLMLERAEQFIAANKDRPFFIYFAANLPHYPYQGDVKWRERYKDLPYPRNLYATALSTIDERIGGLMAALDRHGLRKDTIVVFQSDQGHSTEVRAFGGGGSSGPYRGAKGSFFEGGLRVPAIISWPGTLPEGVVRDQLAHGCDWFPTLAALAGVALPDVALNGRDLGPVLRSAGAESPHEVLQWRLGPQRAVRKGPWKLIQKVRKTGSGPELDAIGKQWFLTNTDEDPGEAVNRYQTDPEIATQLKSLLGK